MLILVVFFQFYRKIHRDSAVLIDEKANTASDYSIKVRNYPNPEEGVDIDEDIKEYFEKNALPGKEVNVTKVNLVYDLTDFKALRVEKDAAILKNQEPLIPSF